MKRPKREITRQKKRNRSIRSRLLRQAMVAEALFFPGDFTGGGGGGGGVAGFQFHKSFIPYVRWLQNQGSRSRHSNRRLTCKYLCAASACTARIPGIVFYRQEMLWLSFHGEWTEEEAGRQHQGMDRPGVCLVPAGSREQRKMDVTGCEVICGAPTTLAVKG